MPPSRPSPPQPSPRRRMPLVPALEALRAVRGSRAVVTSMGSAREWLTFPSDPLDLHYLPSTMGGVVPLALGLALARPDRQLVAISGDGSLLMSPAALVTVAASGAANLAIVLLENAVYEVTGGQPTAAAAAGVDFVQLARSSGIESVASFNDLPAWQAGAAAALALPGPRVIVLHVEPVTTGYSVKVPGPLAPRLAAFATALAQSP